MKVSSPSNHSTSSIGVVWDPPAASNGATYDFGAPITNYKVSYRRVDDAATTSAWLGEDPSRWRHVYFTEPDLILHVRPGILPRLVDELEKGSVVLAPHRLNPLPHLRQFADVVVRSVTMCKE